MPQRKKNGPSPLIALRTDVIHLTSLEAKTLLEKGRELFECMEVTEESDEYLKNNPDLAEVIKKW